MTKYITRIQRGANIRFGLSAAIVILVAVFLFWPNYQQLVKTKSQIVEIDAQNIAVNVALENERDGYRILKNEYTLAATTDENTVAKILPETANETDIIRLLESKVNELAGDDTTSLILNSMNIGSENKEKDADHLSLPIKINTTGSKDKLMALFRFLEKTGASSESNQISRFIDIQNISMQIKNVGDASASNNINADITANAYILPIAE